MSYISAKFMIKIKNHQDGIGISSTNPDPTRRQPLNTGIKAWTKQPAFSWWRHQMETFSALLALCAENSPVTGEFPSQRPVTWSIDVPE